MIVAVAGDKIDKNRITFAGIVSALIIFCLPFCTISIAGIGLLFLLGLPLLALTFINVFNDYWHKPVKEYAAWLFVFFAYSFLSMLWAPDVSSNTVYTYVKVFCVTICLVTNEYLEADKKMMIIASACSCILICVFILTGAYGVGYIEGRATIAVFGVAQDPNYIAYVFYFTIAILINCLIHAESFALKCFSLLLVSLILLCVLLTGSRGATASVIVLTVALILFKNNKSPKIILATIIVAVAILVIFPKIVQYLPSEIANRYTYHQIFETNATGRTVIWKHSLKAIFENFSTATFGYGIGTSVAVVGRATHNHFLQIWVEEGIIGLIIYLGFLVRLFGELRKNSNVICSCVLIAAVVMSLTLSTNTSYYYWGIVAMCVACR